LQIESLAPSQTDTTGEISEGLLHCAEEHWYPVVRGIPRMLPDALEEHWHLVADALAAPERGAIRWAVERSMRQGRPWTYDRRTRENFSLEWEHHTPGDRTWGMDLDDRVSWFFLHPLRLASEALDGMVVLDAGCGNGSQSVAYTELGVEVVALDLSSGLEHGQVLRHARASARPDRVHFVQGDLQSPPLAPASFDVIHSAGVLQATPDTERTFRGLCPLLRPGGRFYLWVLKYEPVVTPLVNTLRAVSTRIAPRYLAEIAEVMAPPFQLFCMALNALKVREYSRLSRREAALALLDIFGAPYAHHHSFEEIKEWYRSEGFDEVWPCNDGRRGLGACGILTGARAPEAGALILADGAAQDL